MFRRALLLCGVLSSLLYLETDIIGGLYYDGYSFTSQAVSELMAVGAPSEHVVDPMFIAYGVLVAAFGIGVLQEGVRLGRAVRVVGGLLIGYAVVGLTGPTLFEMHQRGASDLTGDLPHIVLTGVLVVLVVATIVVAASALGKRFRAYSFATLLTMVVAGAASAPYGARLAAGEPTPGFGIIERINIYASLLWVAMLAIVLLQRSERARPNGGPVMSTASIDGFVAPPWTRDTRVVVISTTKGLSAMTLAVANARGWIDYDALSLTPNTVSISRRKPCHQWQYGPSRPSAREPTRAGRHVRRMFFPRPSGRWASGPRSPRPCAA